MKGNIDARVSLFRRSLRNERFFSTWRVCISQSILFYLVYGVGVARDRQRKDFKRFVRHFHASVWACPLAEALTQVSPSLFRPNGLIRQSSGGGPFSRCAWHRQNLSRRWTPWNRHRVTGTWSRGTVASHSQDIPGRQRKTRSKSAGCSGCSLAAIWGVLLCLVYATVVYNSYNWAVSLIPCFAASSGCARLLKYLFFGGGPHEFRIGEPSWIGCSSFHLWPLKLCIKSYIF